MRALRLAEGLLRGHGREMTQLEVVRAIRAELRQSLSQSYLSQIESGARPHLSQNTRALLAKFFKVHPGFLVGDPEGYHTELTSTLRTKERELDEWLFSGAERFGRDSEVSEALLKLARHQDSRKCLRLLSAILDTPQLVERLLDVLQTSDRPVESPPAPARADWVQ